MTAEDRLAELRRSVEQARAMPLSTSAVVNRVELLSLLDALADELRGELAAAAEVVAAKDAEVEAGRLRAEELVAQARSRQHELASETEVLRRAREQADTEVATARQEAEALRKEVDEYVDTKLAGFEVALERSLQTVRRGRSRLAGDPGSLDGADVRLPEHLDG